MSKKHRRNTQPIPGPKTGWSPTPIPGMVVTSLLDQMNDEGSYESLIQKVPPNGQLAINVAADLRRAIAEVEAVTARPLLIYASNVVRNEFAQFSAIDQNDDLPFAEMIERVPADQRHIDILVVTPGGSAQQVSLFVDKLRRRFDTVNFILPAQCMSAGTIWALSGDQIWMDERAYIGPIDPQVQSRDGRWIPAQALLVLIKDIQEKGQIAIKSGQNPDWTHVQLLRNIDPKEIGNTLSGSQYAMRLASSYLTEYKFRSWTTHESGAAVTQQDKAARANEIAAKLCSHEDWKTHSHGISRDVAWTQLKLKIERPESVPGLQKAIRRLWTVLYWSFENSGLTKCFVAQQFAIFRNQAMPQVVPQR